MTTVAQFDAWLKFTCPDCGGRWKAYEDAKLCHGKEPCTRQVDCKAGSHWGDCKSMPSTQYYTLARITALAREYADHARRHWAEEDVVDTELQLSLFVSWLARREQGKDGE